MHQIEQRVTARCDMGPLTEDEIAGYVLHRLVVSGDGPSRVEFDSDVFTLIYGLSRGNPRLVNRICDRVLTLGYEQSASVMDAALIQTAANDLDLIPPARSSARLWRLGVAAAALVGLMLTGGLRRRSFGAGVARSRCGRAFLRRRLPLCGAWCGRSTRCR